MEILMETLQQQETKAILFLGERIKHLEDQLESAMERNKKLMDILADKQKEIDDMKDLLMSK
jgi:predicted  nucleic acid-binding Zn-ribbon protein